MTVDLAARLHSLHEDLLVLPNCWDVGSARLVERAGATALATSSAAVAWSLGWADGNHLPRDVMLDHLRRITATAQVPVSCDLEGGFGESDAALAETTRLVTEAGAVGVNLEDTVDGGFRSVDEAAHRVGVVRSAASATGVEVFLNARTDTYLAGRGDYAETITRAHAYLEAGASGVFVPGIADLDLVARLTHDISAPVNVLVGPGAPTVAQLKAVGVRRVSAGSAIAEAIYGHVARAATQMMQAGSFDEMAGALTWGEMNALFE